MVAAPITDVREISRIGYGFMASRALFAALDLDVFGRLADGPRDLPALARDTGVAPNRLLALLSACVALGLLGREGERYANAPAAATYLVRGAPAYFGDYFRFQIARQIYPTLQHLEAALAGEAVDFYAKIQDPAEARHFALAQHSGSLGPAHVVAGLVDLTGCRTLLDVGGGSGAFSITLCRRHPELRATILDFPSVAPTATELVAEAGLADRIRFVGGDALRTPWPAGQDVVLMSYLMSAVAADRVGELLRRARGSAGAGGRLLVHDFVLDDDRTGPATAALWLLNAITIDPDVASLTPAWLAEQVAAAGFVDVQVREVIPGITRLLTARVA
jgi:cyclopropane fatty-acyl-phospholipid synthase-like methyltransferase